MVPIRSSQLVRMKWTAIAFAIYTSVYNPAYAADWFNPIFLSKDAGTVADLSRFENGAGQAPGVYRVDVFMNDEFITTSNIRFDVSDGKIALAKATRDNPADDTGLRPCLTLKWLKRLGIAIPVDDHDEDKSSNAESDKNQCMDLSHIYPGATSRFDFSGQKLYLSFPQAAIQNSARGYIPPEEWDEGINAALLNYSLTGDHGNDSDSRYLNLDGGLNIGAWRFRHNGSLSYSNHKNGSARREWQNISTYAQRTVVPLRSELVVGDSSSGTDIFDSIGFRGIRIYSAENMYPDSQQGYAPTVRGIASGRSKITVRQNGYVIYQNIVQAGSFEISDLNPTTSSGDLDVVVEADGGDIQRFRVPYSTVPLLQREGRIKYEIVAGKYRSGSANKGAPFFAQGTLARGFRNGTTIYGGTQLGERYQSEALGLGRNFGDMGALSVDLTNAQSKLADESEHQGQSLRFLYAKSLNSLGTTFQLLGYRYSTKGFYTLDDVAWDNMQGFQYAWRDDEDGHGYHPEPVSYHDLRRNKKGRFQLNISQQLGEIGSLYVSGSEQSYWNTSGTDSWYQAGFTSAWHGITYNLSWSMNHSIGLSGSNRLLSLRISIPFGRFLGHEMPEHDSINSMYATAEASQNQDGVSLIQTGVSGTLLQDNNLSYSIMQGENSRSGENGSISGVWKGTYGSVNAGYNHNRYDKSMNWGISGGVVAHANGVTFTQQLGDTNVLIKAPGAKGVKVENETGVKTDWRGYAILPYASQYRRNRIALDVKSLDIHTDIDDNVQNVVPTEGAIVRAEYVTHTGDRALLTLLHNGHPVPFGAIATEKTTGMTGITGQDGQVYLTGIPKNGNLEIVWGNTSAQSCKAPYNISNELANTPVVSFAVNCR